MGQMINKFINQVDVGSLIFISDPKSGKKRPHVCVSVFRNESGVPYNWMVIPITSVATVGFENLIEIEHPKLKRQSYAKINNLTCIKAMENIEIAKTQIAYNYLLEIAVRIKELILK